jgi:hypothetical protein
MTTPQETRLEALERFEPLAAGVRALVFEAIRGRGADGATADEIQRSLRLTHQACSARVHYLARDGAIVPSGRTRPTSSGRQAVVWVAAERPPVKEERGPSLRAQLRAAQADLAESKREIDELRMALDTERARTKQGRLF